MTARRIPIDLLLAINGLPEKPTRALRQVIAVINNIRCWGESPSAEALGTGTLAADLGHVRVTIPGCL